MILYLVLIILAVLAATLLVAAPGRRTSHLERHDAEGRRAIDFDPHPLAGWMSTSQRHRRPGSVDPNPHQWRPEPYTVRRGTATGRVVTPIRPPRAA